MVWTSAVNATEDHQQTSSVLNSFVIIILVSSVGAFDTVIHSIRIAATLLEHRDSEQGRKSRFASRPELKNPGPAIREAPPGEIVELGIGRIRLPKVKDILVKVGIWVAQPVGPGPIKPDVVKHHSVVQVDTINKVIDDPMSGRAALQRLHLDGPESGQSDEESGRDDRNHDAAAPNPDCRRHQVHSPPESVRHKD